MKKLNLNIIKVWFLSYLIILIILFLMFKVGQNLIFIYLNRFYNIYNISFFIIMILFLLFTIINPFINYLQFEYYIDEEKIEIIHGLFFVRQSVIPISKVQYLTIIQGPLNKLFNLTKVKISTSNTVIKIEGLTKLESEILYNNVKRKIKSI